MTDITPEQADRLKQDATDGPWSHDGGVKFRNWHVNHVGPISSMCNCDGLDVSEEDADLAAAAPDLAQTVIEQGAQIERLQESLRKAENIAGMTWEWRIEEWSGSYWYPCGEWDTDGSAFDGYTARRDERLISRLAPPRSINNPDELERPAPTRIIDQAERLDRFKVGTVGRTARTREAWERDAYGWNSPNRTGGLDSKDLLNRFGPMTILFDPEEES